MRQLQKNAKNAENAKNITQITSFYKIEKNWKGKYLRFVS